MKHQRRALALAAALIIGIANVAAVAQQTLDRTKIPTPGTTPVLRVPTWTKTQLSNGATLIVSSRHNLPSFLSRSRLLVDLISLRRPKNVVWLR